MDLAQTPDLSDVKHGSSHAYPATVIMTVYAKMNALNWHTCVKNELIVYGISKSMYILNGKDIYYGAYPTHERAYQA